MHQNNKFINNLKLSIMKSMKTNGQVLSEKEMKEVKGGKVFTVSEPTAKICPLCESRNIKLVVDTKYKYLCEDCGNMIK